MAIVSEHGFMEQSRVGRRVILGAGAWLLATSALSQSVKPPGVKPLVKPGDPGWPSSKAWAALNAEVGGRLSKVRAPTLDTADAKKLLSNPFYLGSEPALTQSSGWIDAWRSAPSEYVVRAKTSADVAAAVRFAATNRIRLVVKGGGHSYVGGSNAAASLLVWTPDMDEIQIHDDFVPSGGVDAPVRAVSVGAGCLWLRVYQAVTGKAGRYVQGGGCTTVGVAGFVQGGGFGSYSKAFGTGAANLLEAEVVTADGIIRTVNAHREPDLFWALKAGGGGTFGIVTRMTLRTHDLPETFGAVLWEVRARSDEAFRSLLAHFIDAYSAKMFNAQWGEQVRATGDNRMWVQMLFHGLDASTARAPWAELEALVAGASDLFEVIQPMQVITLPARKFWDAEFLRANAPGLTVADDRPGSRSTDYWWTGNTQEAGTFWHGYHSMWMPSSLLQPPQRAGLAAAWFAASRHWSVTMHFNKGLAGGSTEAVAATRDTAMNTDVVDAFALAIIACDGPSAYPELPAPDLISARADAGRLRDAAATLRVAAPSAGSYMSECDFFLADWQRACWGKHWPRLARIKQEYDPSGLFLIHHGVGSDALA